MNVTICRNVDSVTEPGYQSSPDDDVPATAAEASGGRRYGDVNRSAEVLPLSPNHSWPCHGDINPSPCHGDINLSPNHGGRCQSDVDHSPEVPPPSSSDDVICVSEEETGLENNNEKSKESCGESPSAIITACGDSFKNVKLVTKSFDRMTIQHPVWELQCMVYALHYMYNTISLVAERSSCLCPGVKGLCRA